MPCLSSCVGSPQMLPEVIRLLEALSLVAVVVLILPKRSWGSLTPRFRDLMVGRRVSLFEPPGRRPAPMFNQFQAELHRIFELGVPVFVAARILERRALSLREVERTKWRTSSSAVLLDLL